MLGPARSRKPDWVVRRVIRLKALMPDAGCRALALTFNRLHEKSGISVGKSFVSDTLRRHAYAVEEDRRAIRRRRARRGPRNVTWAVDLTGKGDAAGRNHQILGLIDHGSRRLLDLRTLARTSSWTLLGHLCLAIGKYGKPAILRSDNASVFTSRLFRSALAVLGIRHQRSDVGAPWQNGRIERLFGTLKNKLDRWTVMDAGQLDRASALFSVWYNTVRPHQALDGLTPQEAWDDVDPILNPPRKAEWFSAWDGLLTGFVIRR